MPKHERLFRGLRVASYAVLLAVLVGLLLQSQAVTDWWKLRGYQPSSAVTKLADDTTMTAKARHLFYLNHPSIADKKSFAKSCPSGGEKTIVLGCYKSGERGIYVLSVTDKRLPDVEQVTAAHETLHSAYERLNAKDKTHVDTMLQDFYDHGLQDQRIKDVLKSYESSEPGEQLNEMHSIFGTEVAKLPANLENYYKQYFTDRIKIARYAAKYEGVFTSRQESIKKDDAQLAAWKKQISTDQSLLESRRAELESEQGRLNASKSSGNTETYNALVVSYNAKVDEFNSLLAQTKSLIDQYNALVAARNAIALETTQLEEALSGSLSPISQ